MTSGDSKGKAVMKASSTRLVYTPIFENLRALGGILAPKDMRWITELPEGGRQTPYVMHLSCMAHYTPHIPHIAQRILERAGVECPILGGTESCCGTLHVHFGDPDLGRHAAHAGIAGFKRARPTTVVSICPDCDESFNSFLPEKRPFEVVNIAALLVELLPRIERDFRPVGAKVILHKHLANEARQKDMENIETILHAIPGIEVLDSLHSLGPEKHCNVLGPMSAENQAAMLREAEALGAAYIVVPYHSCYRQHCMLELHSNVKVQHYIGLVAQALGIDFEERYKELRLLDDLEKAVDRLMDEANERGISRDVLRGYLQSAIYCH